MYDIIKACQSYFFFELPSVLIPERVNTFTSNLDAIWDFLGCCLPNIIVLETIIVPYMYLVKVSLAVAMCLM